MLFSKHIFTYFWFAIVNLLTANSILAFQGAYPIQNFTPAEYRAGIQNIDFAQNRDMSLFVANNLGVLSFNGQQWETHVVKTGIKNRSLAFDESNNRLYVGLQGEFGYFDQDWNYVSLSLRIPEHARDFDEVWDVFLANDEVYFCTFQGIYVFDGKQIRVITHESGLQRSFFAGGKLFTQSQQGSLFEVAGDSLIHIYAQNKPAQIIAGIVYQDGGYLLFYNSGLIQFVTSHDIITKYDKLIEALNGTYVNHVLQLSDTRLVISTQTSGLFLYDTQSGTIEHISSDEGLQTNACLRSFQDYSGNLWVGMQNGIAMVNINAPMRLIKIPGSGYEAFVHEDGTYYTTSNGIYFLAKNSNQLLFLTGTEGPAYGLQEIAGKLYVGHHTGLWQLESGRAKQIAPTDGLWKVEQLRSNRNYAIGGTYSGLYLFRLNADQLLKPVQRISGFDASSRFFEEDALGRIWVGQYYQGLYQVNLSEDLTEAQATNISEVCELPVKEQIILSHIQDDLYLATNTGLYQLNPLDCSVLKDNIFANIVGRQEVYLFVQDQKNNVHMVAEDAVGFFKSISPTNYQFVPSSLYQLRYHLNNDLLQISVHTNDGVLLSANEGFIQYNPELEQPIKAEQPLLVNQILSVTENKLLYRRQPFEGKPEGIDSLIIGPRAKVLKIDVESFQFNDQNNKQYRYLLRGFEDDFGAWTRATTKEYTNLDHGTYEFVAQARNHLGTITSSQRLFLKVKPPLHKSALAYIFYIILAAATLYTYFRFQKVRYKRKAEALERSKRSELERKQQKILEVEHQKEQEVRRLQDEKVKSELKHVNNLLAASTMNLVVKNEFIESIKEELKEVKQKGKNQETKRALEKIVKEIDTTLRIQEDWEQFEYHFDQVHGNFLPKLRNQYPDLSPNDQKICALLRLNLSTKEIANLLSISMRGVEVARYRLRKKLGLQKGQNLTKFILEFDGSP